MKDVIKTAVLVCIILLILVIVFVVLGRVKYEVEKLSRVDLSNNDPTVRILYNRVKNNTGLRKAYLSNDNLTSSEIIKYFIDNHDDDDIDKKVYEAKKITCQITDTIDFTTSTGKCNVAIINNKTISEFQKKYFNSEIDLVFDDFKYHGYNCKNTGKKYYCLIEDYSPSVYGYSVLDSAYEVKNEVFLYEYYFQIDFNDTDRCLTYFDDDTCSNFSDANKIYVDENIIRNDGVLYCHVFKKKDDSYFLDRSYVVGDI